MCQTESVWIMSSCKRFSFMYELDICPTVKTNSVATKAVLTCHNRYPEGLSIECCPGLSVSLLFAFALASASTFTFTTSTPILALTR